MTKRMANRDVPAFVKNTPDYEVEGYGAVSYTPRGYWTGYLPARLKERYSEVKRRQTYVPTIYSYGTPIAWYDEQAGRWIIPAVSYSVTTAKHQSALYALDGLSIPADCGPLGYERIVKGLDRFERYSGKLISPHAVAA